MKQCDLGQPSCARCIRGGRTCDGYGIYTISLNRTAQGAGKRQRLDEAEPSAHTDLVQAPISANDWKEILAALANSQHTNMISQISSSPAFDSQILAIFYQKYLPVNRHIQGGYGRSWLHQAIGLQNPGDALYLSLKALSMTRLGRLCKDEKLAFQGAIFYGRALRQLQRALQDRTIVCQDETLAAGFILALYEVSRL